VSRTRQLLLWVAFFNVVWLFCCFVVVFYPSGDTRAVLARSGTAIELTTDHIPTLQSETERIHRAGGAIVRGRVQGVLGVSRSFGDIEYKTLREKSWGSAITADLVIATPAIKIVEIVPEDEFIIIASDGLFDVSLFAALIGDRLLFFLITFCCCCFILGVLLAAHDWEI